MVIKSESHTVTTVLCLSITSNQNLVDTICTMYNLSYLLIPGEPIYVILLHLHLKLESFKALI